MARVTQRRKRRRYPAAQGALFLYLRIGISASTLGSVRAPSSPSAMRGNVGVMVDDVEGASSLEA